MPRSRRKRERERTRRERGGEEANSHLLRMLPQVPFKLRTPTPPNNRRSERRPPTHDKVYSSIDILRSSRVVGRMLENDEGFVERVEGGSLLVLFDGAESGGLGEGEDAIWRDQACEREEWEEPARWEEMEKS
jgi:hypothetical protein